MRPTSRIAGSEAFRRPLAPNVVQIQPRRLWDRIIRDGLSFGAVALFVVFVAYAAQVIAG